MLTQQLELSLSHLGLGTLSESALLTIFAQTQLQYITQGTQTTLWSISSSDKIPLYPAWYMLRLSVPPTYLLSSFKLADKVLIETGVKTYGGMLLDSFFSIKHAQNTDESLPKMSGGNLFIGPGQSKEPELGIPKPGILAELPKLDVEPESLKLFRRMRKAGINWESQKEFIGQTIRYPLVNGRDVVFGKNLMFSKYPELFDFAERIFLSQELFPPLPIELVDCRSLLDRQIFYFGNCQANDTLAIRVQCSFRSCSPNFHGSRNDIISVGLVETKAEIYQDVSKELLATNQSVKLLNVPSNRQSLLHDSERIISRLVAQSEKIESNKDWMNI